MATIYQQQRDKPKRSIMISNTAEQQRLIQRFLETEFLSSTFVSILNKNWLYDGKDVIVPEKVYK